MNFFCANKDGPTAFQPVYVVDVLDELGEKAGIPDHLVGLPCVMFVRTCVLVFQKKVAWENGSSTSIHPLGRSSPPESPESGREGQGSDG